MGVPLPASTQWDIVEKTADRIHPVYRELTRQAAQGSLIHNDDTTMKILAAVNEKGRSGTFTTGMLSVTGERTIALFFTGGKHAGENFTEVLRHRHAGLDPPMQMATPYRGTPPGSSRHFWPTASRMHGGTSWTWHRTSPRSAGT